MELEYLFTPVEFKKINNWRQLPKWALGRLIEDCNQRYSNEIKSVDIAIFGVEEVRNANEFQKNVDVDRIRSMFYQLNNIDSNLKIIDLGNLKLGKRVNDTYFCLQEISRFLLSKNIRPIIIGGTQDLIVPLSKLLTNELSGNCVILDSKIDYEIDYDLFDADQFLNGFTDDNKSKTTILGYQNYFIDEQTKTTLEKKGMEFIRLGKVRDDFHAVEPIIRDARIVSIDSKCIRNGDFSGNRQPSPNGFYAHEVCQLAWYAGQSNIENIFVLNGYQGYNDTNGSDAMLYAQLAWHYVKGVFLGTDDFIPQKKEEMDYYIVEFEGEIDYSMSFIRNKTTLRWWMAIEKKNRNRIKYQSCAETDYLQACQNKVSERALRIINTTK